MPVPPLLLLLLPTLRPVMSNVPRIYVDTVMSLVKVPADVPINTTIYRVKAADSDKHYPLKFWLPGELLECCPCLCVWIFVLATVVYRDVTEVI